MKCKKCGYDDRGTGDFSHVCSVETYYTIPPAMPSQPSGASAEQIASLIDLLNVIKPNYGDVGSRDCDVTVKSVVIEDAIKILTSLAAPVAPPRAQEPQPIAYWDKAVGGFYIAGSNIPDAIKCRAMPLYAAPSPAIGGPVQDERASFEAAYIAAFGDPSTIGLASGIEFAWISGPGIMWQARAALAAKTAQPTNVQVLVNRDLIYPAALVSGKQLEQLEG